MRVRAMAAAPAKIEISDVCARIRASVPSPQLCLWCHESVATDSRQGALMACLPQCNRASLRLQGLQEATMSTRAMGFGVTGLLAAAQVAFATAALAQQDAVAAF